MASTMAMPFLPSKQQAQALLLKRELEPKQAEEERRLAAFREDFISYLRDYSSPLLNELQNTPQVPTVCKVVDGRNHQMLERNCGRETTRSFEKPLGDFVEHMVGEKQQKVSVVENPKNEWYHDGFGRQAPLSTSLVTSPLPKKPPDPPDMIHRKGRTKGNTPSKYSCEEIYERMEMGLCVFCEEFDTPGHYQLKHKGSKIFMTECVDNVVSHDKTVVEETVRDDKTSLEQETIPSTTSFQRVHATQSQGIESNDGQPLDITGSLILNGEATTFSGQKSDRVTEPLRLKQADSSPANETILSNATQQKGADAEQKNESVISVRAEHVWEPGGLSAKPDMWYWTEKFSSYCEAFLYPQMQMLTWDPGAFRLIGREKSNNTLWPENKREDRHKQNKVMKLASSWHNRLWEPGGVVTKQVEVASTEGTNDGSHENAEDSSEDQMEFTTMVKFTAFKGQEKVIEVGCVTASFSIDSVVEQSLMQNPIQENWYKKTVSDAVYQKRAAAESEQLATAVTDRRRMNSRLKQVSETASSVQSQILKKQKCLKSWRFKFKDKSKEHKLTAGLIVLIKQKTMNLSSVTCLDFNGDNQLLLDGIVDDDRVEKLGLVDAYNKAYLLLELIYMKFTGGKTHGKELSLAVQKVKNRATVVVHHIAIPRLWLWHRWKSKDEIIVILLVGNVSAKEQKIIREMSSGSSRMNQRCMSSAFWSDRHILVPEKNMTEISLATFVEECSSVCRILLGAFVMLLLAEASRDCGFSKLLTQWREHPPDKEPFSFSSLRTRMFSTREYCDSLDWFIYYLSGLLRLVYLILSGLIFLVY